MYSKSGLAQLGRAANRILDRHRALREKCPFRFILDQAINLLEACVAIGGDV